MRKPLSPLQAFAEDVHSAAARDVDVGNDAVRWMSIAQTAESLASAHGAHRPTALTAAEVSLAAFAVRRPSMVHDAIPEPSDQVGRVAELLRSAAEDMERLGCFELAYATVSAVCRLTATADYVSASLATLHLGRVAREMNEYAVAKDCYDAMLSTAARKRDAPLAARGHVGLALLHDMKGNLPAAESEYRQALRLASPMGGAYASASQGLMSIALTRNELADALLHGWNVYDASEHDPEVRAGALCDLAGIALRAGCYDAALHGFLHADALVDVPRIHMVIASGVIRSAARFGDRDLVERFDGFMIRDISLANQPYTAAMVLLYAAESWALLAEMSKAMDRMTRSRQLSERFGYAEYIFRADALEKAWSNASRRNSASLLLDTEGFMTSDSQHNSKILRGIERLRAVGV